MMDADNYCGDCAKDITECTCSHEGVEMTTQADIKLVIDQLNDMCEPLLGDDFITFDNAVTIIETLGNQIAAQAAVIEKLRWALKFYANPASDTFGNTARRALDTSTDSTQVLQEWLDEKLGEPIATKLETQQFNCFHVSSNDSKRLKELPVGAQLFKKPESFGVCV